MRTRSLLLTLLFTLCVLPLAAQLESGKVYRFVNKANTNIAMASASDTEIYGSEIDTDSYAQLWLAETHPGNSQAWTLRSLGNGRYAQHRGQSQVWSFANKASIATPLFFIDLGNGYYTFNNSNSNSGYACMHYATSQGGAVVGWTSTADATQWTFTEVSISKEEIEANWKEIEDFNSILTDEYLAKCKTALGNLFSDDACTVLKKSFANVAAIEADADYKVLPAALQNMVKKVYSGDWSEANYDSSKPQWDSEYGKRFRVQSYEPYSIAGDVTEWLGINAHINMDNPTGLFGNMRQHVFVMVEGEIKQGASLELCAFSGHGLLWNGTAGTVLKPGLNIIPFNGDGNAMYIKYLVDTYNAANKTFPYKLSDFPNLKIHIEGGNINGYYNGVGDHVWGEPDDDTDWLYYEERYNLENVTILGKRQILHFCQDETVEFTDDDGKHTVKGMSYYLPERVQVPAGTPANQKINTMLEAWDRIHLSELITMGLLSKEEVDSLNNLYYAHGKDWKNPFKIYTCDDEFYEFQKGVDYSEHFNHHGVAYGNFSGYMSGGWQNCNYHHNTMNSIIGEIAVNAGSAWGPAHEIGHQHQSAMNLNGLTEVTNNLFSNVAVWYMGLGTSRMNGDEGNLAHVNETYTNGGDFFDNNIWALTHMYYRLWLYYHLAGHNTRFFPRLYECLRNERMPRIYYTTGEETILRFYRHACVAAGEDLTEFFRAHGFFKVMESRHVGDYANSEYTQSQEDIDKAIAWVKAKGYKENIAPLFINDCTPKATYSHDGKTKRAYWDPNHTPQGKNATIGMYTDCFDLETVAENYLYTLSNSTVKIIADNGKGAIGFIIYDNNDNLVAFTNNYTVKLPITAGNNVKVYAVQADGTKVELLTAAEAGTEEQQLEALGSAIAAATTVLNKTSDDGTVIGYFYTEATAELSSILEQAKAAKENADQSKYTYGKWATMLTNEIDKITEDKYARVRIKEGNVHTIDNRAGYFAYYNYVLKAANTGQVPASSDDRKWEFVSTGVEDEFYIKNVGQSKYVTSIEDGEAVTLTSSSTSAAAKFTATYTNDGMVIFTLAGSSSLAIGAKSNKDIVGAAPTGTYSEWRVRITENNAKAAESVQLDELIDEANRIIDEIGTINGTSVTVNSTVTNAANNLVSLVLALNATLANAEENKETAVDLARYIDAMEVAIANIDNTYILIPEEKKPGFITWYYIKSVEDGTYFGIDTESTSSTYSTSVSLTELDKENKNHWFAFDPTGNENEYKIYCAGQENYLYTSSRSFLKADGEDEAGVYTVTVDAENGGLIISEGKKYLNNSNAKYTKTGSAKSYWKIMRVGASETGIEEIFGEQQENNGAIYDLYGRKVNEITESGIYIINGKKVLVK